MTKTKIKCPNCSADIDVDEVFKHQAEESLKKEYTEKLSKELSAISLRKEAVEAEMLKVKKLKEEQDDIIRAKLIEERKKMKEEAEFKAKKDLEFEILKIKQDSEIKTKENLKLKKKEVEILNKERELRDKEDQLDIDAEKKMIEKARQIEARAIMREQEKNVLKQKEFEKQIEDQSRIIAGFDRKEFEMLTKEKELKENTVKLKVEMERQMVEKTKETEDKVRKAENEKKDALSREYEKKIAEQNKLIDEKKRKEEELIKRENELKAQSGQLRIDMEKQMKEKEEELIRKQNELKAQSGQLRIDMQKQMKEKEEELIRKENELKAQSGQLRIDMEKQMKEKERKIEENTLIESRKKEEEFSKVLGEQKKSLEEMKKKEIKMLNERQEAREREEQLKLDLERQMLDREKDIRDKAIKFEHEKNELKNREYEKQLDIQKRLIDELKKKAEQGSQQLQGEIQELALEDFLISNFPFDNIVEVKKGQRGADALHIVRNNLQQECGKIIYESKRTQAFSEKWIEKLKEDQQFHQAEIAVIVTETMPNDIEKFGKRQGVWICSYQEIKNLSFVLREMLLMTHSVKSVQENKGDKMEMLYNYVTSNEFARQVEGIVEAFHGLLNDLNREKIAMEKIWNTREKQIRKVLVSTGAMHGSLKGIAGNAIENIKILELPEPEDF